MLHRHNLIPDQVVDARKDPLAGEEAWRLLVGVREIVVAQGKKILKLEPHRHSKEEILQQTLGRTGNLRAPTLLTGDRLLVGFNESLYAHYLG